MNESTEWLNQRKLVRLYSVNETLNTYADVASSVQVLYHFRDVFSPFPPHSRSHTHTFSY